MSSPDLGNNNNKGKEEITEIEKHIETLNDNLNGTFSGPATKLALSAASASHLPDLLRILHEMLIVIFSNENVDIKRIEFNKILQTNKDTLNKNMPSKKMTIVQYLASYVLNEHEETFEAGEDIKWKMGEGDEFRRGKIIKKIDDTNFNIKIDDANSAEGIVTVTKKNIKHNMCNYINTARSAPIVKVTINLGKLLIPVAKFITENGTVLNKFKCLFKADIEKNDNGIKKCNTTLSQINNNTDYCKVDIKEVTSNNNKPTNNVIIEYTKT